jgi:predicted protein tyrosine phosphatase
MMQDMIDVSSKDKICYPGTREGWRMDLCNWRNYSSEEIESAKKNNSCRCMWKNGEPCQCVIELLAKKRYAQQQKHGNDMEDKISEFPLLANADTKIQSTAASHSSTYPKTQNPPSKCFKFDTKHMWHYAPDGRRFAKVSPNHLAAFEKETNQWNNLVSQWNDLVVQKIKSSHIDPHKLYHLDYSKFIYLRTTPQEAIVSMIHPDIYLTGWVGSNDIQQLQHYGITHIIRCMTPYRPSTNRETYLKHYVNRPAHVMEYMEHQGIQELRMNFFDSPDVDITPYSKLSSELIKVIRKNNGRVLVHCDFGISRSTTLVIDYMIKDTFQKIHSLISQKADFFIQHLKSKRPVVSPNTGFHQHIDRLISRLNSTRIPKNRKLLSTKLSE